MQEGSAEQTERLVVQVLTTICDVNTDVSTGTQTLPVEHRGSTIIALDSKHNVPFILFTESATECLLSVTSSWTAPGEGSE